MAPRRFGPANGHSVNPVRKTSTFAGQRRSKVIHIVRSMSKWHIVNLSPDERSRNIKAKNEAYYWSYRIF